MNSAVRLVFSSSKIDDFRSFVSYIQLGWDIRSGFSTSSPFWLSNDAMEQHRRIPGRHCDKFNVHAAEFGTRSCLRSASTSSLPVRRTRLSRQLSVSDLIQLVRTPLLVSGTFWRAMSRPHNLYQLSVAAWRRTSSIVHFLDSLVV